MRRLLLLLTAAATAWPQLAAAQDGRTRHGWGGRAQAVAPAAPSAPAVQAPERSRRGGWIGRDTSPAPIVERSRRPEGMIRGQRPVLDQPMSQRFGRAVRSDGQRQWRGVLQSPLHRRGERPADAVRVPPVERRPVLVEQQPGGRERARIGETRVWRRGDSGSWQPIDRRDSATLGAGTGSVRRLDRLGERRERGARTWSHDWRDHSRFDWHNWRDRNRHLFHRGRYRDPFGYPYQRFLVGWSLWPAYYSSSYWLDDPGYRLPPAPPGTRWVRYWNDALLVDLTTGEVIDVVYNFFW